jgi:hypothetical protein
LPSKRDGFDQVRYADIHFPSLQTNLGNAFRHNGYGTERIGSKKDNLRGERRSSGSRAS